MKNIITICRELGITVPEEMQAELLKRLSENYVTKAEHEKKMQRMKDELDKRNQITARDIFGEVIFRYDCETGITTVSGDNIKIAGEPH